MPGFFVHNFGCRATQADGTAIERQLLDAGIPRSEGIDGADVVVLNTCTVTASADRDARSTIRRLRRVSPHTKILVTGCYAQRAPEEIASLPGVRWVVDNAHKHAISQIVSRFFDRPEGQNAHGFVPLSVLTSLSSGESFSATPAMLTGDIFAHTELMAAPVFEDGGEACRTRPILKVQDGCNNRCSFCVIPFTRGRSRSLELDEAVREVGALVRGGYREVVISGINLGRWGRDLNPSLSFADLVRSILERTSLEKLRISSVEPMDWSDEVIGLWASSARIAKHAHVPLQSGSDAVLRAMHRKYRPWHYEDRVRQLRRAAPGAALGADVMVGFPGETGALFEESRQFIESLSLTYLHVFVFSARPGTPAAEMPQQVPAPVARERSRILRALIAAKNLAFRQSLLGCTLPAITLSEDRVSGDRAITPALTDNFVKLQITGTHPPNRWLQVEIQGITQTGLTGSAV